MDSLSTTVVLRYRAFISYSHHDERWARWLHKALETYRIPARLVGQTTAAGPIPRRLTPIFRDRDELPSATDLSTKVEEALRASANLIVICSPHAAASRWVGEEILAYKRLGRASRIFCLIVAGDPNADAVAGLEAEQCFPAALRIAVDGSGATSIEANEPIAADVRAGKDRKSNAKLRLIAGLIGVGFDALKQREQQRRLRRLAAVAAFTSVIMVGTIALAIDAAIARRTAEHREKQAEDLIGFMLGDLQKKLETVHRLDILNDVADKAMNYFSQSRDVEASNESLAEYAQALQKIGRVREEQGNLGNADAAFNGSLQLMQRLVARDPKNPAWQIALADSHSWLGSVAWDRGDLVEADRQFRMTIPLVDAVVTAHPDNQDWLQRLAWLHNNIGHVQEASGRFAVAKQEYETVLAINEKLVARALERSADRHRARMRLANAYTDLGGIEYAMGSLGKAEDRRQESVALWLELVREAPEDMSVQEYLGQAYYNLADTLSARGESAAAAAALESALALGRRQLQSDPTSKNTQGAVALYSRALSRRRLLDGDPVRAAPLAESSLATYATLAAKEPLELRWQRGLASSRLVNAWIAIAQQDSSVARRYAEAASEVLAELTRQHPENEALYPLVADAEIVLGRLDAGDTGVSAEPHWHAAIDALSVPKSNQRNPDILSRRAEALCWLGDVQEGSALISQLNDIGYREGQYQQQIVASPCHPPRLTASRNR
jgi:tetratricopeptide (TPR) repeat protein